MHYEASSDMLRQAGDRKRAWWTVVAWAAGGALVLVVLISRVVPALLPSGHTVELAWDLVHVATQEAMVIIRASHIPCDEVRTPKAEEFDDRVVISASAMRPSRACVTADDYSYFIVELEVPLGDRRIEGCGRDGPCSELLPSFSE